MWIKCLVPLLILLWRIVTWKLRSKVWIIIQKLTMSIYSPSKKPLSNYILPNILTHRTRLTKTDIQIPFTSFTFPRMLVKLRHHGKNLSELLKTDSPGLAPLNPLNDILKHTIGLLASLFQKLKLIINKTADFYQHFEMIWQDELLCHRYQLRMLIHHGLIMLKLRSFRGFGRWQDLVRTGHQLLNILYNISSTIGDLSET
mmetsp:Transcript_14415/g.10151  ORF Transcript_14415/g.10151 Transcript_14415/m.10151 type:complete len:201 (-) Transcript_14415:413-1015(-)